jgi:hypothetical protein
MNMLDLNVKFWDLVKFCVWKLVPALFISLFAWNVLFALLAGIISAL